MLELEDGQLVQTYFLYYSTQIRAERYDIMEPLSYHIEALSKVWCGTNLPFMFETTFDDKFKDCILFIF